MSPIRSQKKNGYRWALFATALCVGVVVLGAFTRLADAGLGCPDWPGCYGHLTWPKSAESVARAEALFPEAPVEHDKTWPEMIHRYFAGALGLVILGLTVAMWRFAQRAPAMQYPRWHATGLLGLVVLQAAFGMWTVTLKLWPQVVTAHLLGGFATLSLLWLLTLRLRNRPWCLAGNSHRRLVGMRPLIWLALVVVVGQIALGGWTSSNYAAVACPDFPTCQTQWWPAIADFGEGFDFVHEIGPDYEGGVLDHPARVAIHFVHRLGAVLATLLIAAFAVAVRRRPGGQLAGAAMLTALAAQVAIGVGIAVFGVPLSLAVAHNGVAAILLLAVINANQRIRQAS